MMSINIMTIVYVLFVILYLGSIYYRMIRREIPKPIGWLMALVPIALGMATFDISGFTGIKLYLGNATVHEALAKLPAVLESLLGAFLGAGLPEEIYKGIVLIAAILIFKPKKVYEYCLMGAAVGLGFTIMEEFAYMNTPELTTVAMRALHLPAHMSLNMLMGELFGRAKYNKINGKGSQISKYILAFIAPAVMHTIFDAFASNNRLILNSVASGDTGAGFWIGSALMVTSFAGFAVYIYWMIIRLKKKTREFCAMETVSENKN